MAEITDRQDEAPLQVMDTLLFHEYTVVDRLIVRVTAWFPTTAVPAFTGRYQGLVKLRSGTQIIMEFLWDGVHWRYLETGIRRKMPFHWRGLARDPNVGNEL